MNRFYVSATLFLLLVFCSVRAQIITTIAGLPNPNPVPGTSLGMNPLNFVGDTDGNIYFPDAENGLVRKLSPSGALTTIAGNGTHGFSGDGGNALNASFRNLGAITVDPAGNVLLCDAGNNRVRKINTAGIISTIIGGGSNTNEGVAAATAELLNPSSIALDAAGNMYISDRDNNRVRKVTVSALPVRLQEFKTALDERNIICFWKTSEEINSREFLVQRSTDGTSFTTIGTIAARGAGTVLVPYTYTDYNAADQPVQRLYYRLEMIDKDGKKTYSVVNQVLLYEQVRLFSLTPNPAHGFVVVQGAGIKRLKISDYGGRMVKQLAITGSRTVIDVSNLPNGVYTIQAIYADGSNKTEKLAIR